VRQLSGAANAATGRVTLGGCPQRTDPKKAAAEVAVPFQGTSSEHAAIAQSIEEIERPNYGFWKDRMLNAAGAEGWELVGITNNNIAYLKREMEHPAAARSAHGASAAPNCSDATGGGAQAATAKYRDPVTNETWSGRGRMPNWLKRKQEAGEDIEEFLVYKSSVAPSATTRSPLNIRTAEDKCTST
jgi:DNA-binding protein H-NS